MSEEEKQKLLTRAKRFGLPVPKGVVDPAEEAKRAARAARFASGGAAEATTAAS